MQRYAEEAVAEHLGTELQKAFNKELKQKRNPPFANDVDKETADLLMNQARKWSDRYRLMKKAGASEAEILKSFDEPVPMKIFAWNGKKPSGKERGFVEIDTVRKPQCLRQKSDDAVHSS